MTAGGADDDALSGLLDAEETFHARSAFFPQIVHQFSIGKEPSESPLAVENVLRIDEDVHSTDNVLTKHREQHLSAQ